MISTVRHMLVHIPVITVTNVQTYFICLQAENLLIFRGFRDFICVVNLLIS